MKTVTRKPRPNVRSLRRYVHTQGFTRLSGNRRVETEGHGLRARIVLTAVASLAAAVGLWFVFF